MKKIIILIAVVIGVLVTGASYAADVEPTESINWGSRNLSWTLATDMTVSAASDTAVDVEYCIGHPTLTIETSGAVNMTMDIVDGSSATIIKSLTTAQLTADTCGSNKCLVLEATHNIDELYVDVTITAGTVESIKLACTVGK